MAETFRPRRVVRPPVAGPSNNVGHLYQEVVALRTDVLARLSVIERALQAVIEDVDDILGAFANVEDEGEPEPTPEETAANKEARQSLALEQQFLVEEPDEPAPEAMGDTEPEETVEEEAARLRAEAQALAEADYEG